MMPPASPPLPGATARALWDATLSLAFPALCLRCGHRQPLGAGALPVCAPCEQRLPRASADVLAERLAALPESPPRRVGAAGAVGAAHGLWVFDAGGTVQRLQHLLKYGNRPSLARALGERVGRALRFDGADADYDLIVPIPLALTRRLERGYNQSASLAAGLAVALTRPEAVRPDLLVRTRATHSQTALSRSRRWANVEGAFRVAEPAALDGRRVLLVDDVLTTGATLTAAARPLLEAGARVDLAVFAVASV